MPPHPLSSSSEAPRCSTSAGEIVLARGRNASRRNTSSRHTPDIPSTPSRYRDAHEAFRSLHRLDRDWPFLLEWLVRSKAHWLRHEGHVASQGAVPRIVGRPPPAPGSPPPAEGGAGGAAGAESADTVAAAAQRAKASHPDHCHVPRPSVPPPYHHAHALRPATRTTTRASG